MSRLQREAQGVRLLWGGFWSARIIITANNYHIFDQLQEPTAADQVARAIAADPRATEVLLDALTALRLVRKQKGLYRNTRLSGTFLVSGTPHYQGDILKHADNLWQGWSQLDGVIKTGNPATKVDFDHRAFIMGMHNIAYLIAPEVIGAIGMAGVTSALDLGGGPGTYTLEMRRQGAPSVTHFDLPATTAIARQVAAHAGVPDGITFRSGDVLKDELGTGYDLILLSQFIHSFAAEENLLVFTKACRALRPGGRIAVQEFPLHRDHASPTQGALFSVNMLVNTPGGRCYPPSEIRSMLRQAGFVRASSSLVAGNSLTIASRPKNTKAPRR